MNEIKPIAWICTRETTKGGRVFDQPFVAMNLAYAEAHPLHDWGALYDQQAIDTMRAEVERLRVIAGCAYQMAGMHDAPEIWLDRLSEAANGDPIPDPDTLMDELLPYQPDAVCDAERDAGRYRWLRDSANPIATLTVGTYGDQELDEAIDAAMSEQP